MSIKLHFSVGRLWNSYRLWLTAVLSTACRRAGPACHWEHIFSVAGEIVSKRRSALRRVNVKMPLCLQSWLQ